MDVVTLVVVIAAGAVAIVTVATGWIRLARQRRAERRRAAVLHERFGPEYDLAVARAGRHDGERELEARIERYAELDHPKVAPASRRTHTETWQRIQFEFIDTPERSVREAEHLVVTVMDERGFPTDDAVVRADALSVEHPDLAESYRAAHRAFALAERGQASIEQLLGAVLTYRELFEQLLERPRHEPTTFDGSSVPDQALASLAERSGAAG
jgi:hypothetical protein